MKSWIAILLLSVSSFAFSQEWATSAAVKRIATTGTFAFGGVGFAGTTSDGEKDFKVILSLPAAEASVAFEKLYETGNPQAKSYALAGIRKLDRTRFSDLLLSVRASDLKVQTARGCIVSKRSLEDVAEDLNSGRYDPWIR